MTASRIVLDANIIVGALMPMDYSDAARDCLRSLLARDIEILAPSLLEYEVVTSFRRLVQAGVVKHHQADIALAMLAQLGLHSIHPAPELIARSLHWAEQLGQSRAYDAMYLAVAEAFDAELWTADRRLARRARQLGLDWVHAVIDETPADG